ncbi:MAG TPA: amidase [Anaerolineaceae bacterium]
MTVYDLKSLELPRLYGTPLNLFAAALRNPVGRSLLIGSLLESGGITKLRAMDLFETPTGSPLRPARIPATGCVELPELDGAAPHTRNVPYTTIRDYASAYRAGETTPEQVAGKILAAVENDRGQEIPLNAFVLMNREDLYAQARASTARWQAGRPISPLDGAPIAVKDEIDQSPYPTNVGTSFLGKSPRPDATLVGRLRALGALLIGKTTMREIGINPNGENLNHGRIANPYNPRCDPGGSSSGSAAAVAAGFCPAAIGADGGGSIRIPAGLCGVVGLKATYGRVSEKGAAPLCWSVAHNGPLTASVEDAALVYAAIAGPDPADPNSLVQPAVILEGWNNPDLRGLKAGVYREWFRHASPEVVQANEQLLEKLSRAGLEIVEAEIPGLDALRIAHAVTILNEMAVCMQPYEAEFTSFSPSTQVSLILGKVFSGCDYLKAQQVRTRAMRTFDEIFGRVDVLLTPATGMTAPLVPQQALSRGWSDLAVDTEVMRFVYPANMTGHPAISFPAGYSQAGLPIGMQAMGRHWEEQVLLRVAYAAEEIVERRRPANFYPILES